MMRHIKEISLDDLLPEVFAREKMPHSDVWRTSLELRKGQKYLIESASGGGKSSLAAFLSGNRRDYEGEIKLNGENIRSLSIDEWQEIRRSHIAYLPQELGLFPELSAFDNIMLKANLTPGFDPASVGEWMRRLGVDARRDYPAGKLSIGQQQRVALIRSLCQPFDFILLDEPVSHLDEDNNRIAAQIVEEEALRQDAAIVVFSVGNPLQIDNPVKLKL